LRSSVSAWPCLVEGHHDDGGAVARTIQPRLAQELGLALLQRDRVDDALALHALQAGLDDAPLRAVDHDRHARDVGLGGDEVEEATIAATPSSMPSSMLTSMICAPFSTCWRATASAS
jgi:hypothetical protein